ncbi:hypothetical protein EIP86_010190 [Pleurotus ostreatoroseus]|nr:hypothetical protein EIP86_010190 [Pleurotus ostreatoroseus]
MRPYSVTNFTNPAILQVALWPYTFTPIATALASVVTQTFLGWRVYRLSNSRVLYGLIMVFAVPACVIGIVCGTKAWIIKFSAELVVLQKLVTAWLVLQLSVDIFTATTLGWLLWSAKTGFQRTDTVLNRLIRGAIQTGFFAAIFAAGDLITFLRVPSTNFYGMFAIPIGRIYTNTLLDTLLTRTELKHKLNGAIDMDSTRQAPSMLQWAPATGGSTTRNDSTNIPLSEISTQKEVVVFGDDGIINPRDLKGSAESV